MDRCGDPHYAYLPIILMPDHVAPFALWTAFPSSLGGRDSSDYYEASVAIPSPWGSRPVGDPVFVPVVRIERNVGGPLISLYALTGHRPASGGCPG